MMMLESHSNTVIFIFVVV